MTVLIPKKYLRISSLLALALSIIIHYSLVSNHIIGGNINPHIENFPLEFVAFEVFSTFIIGFVIFCINYLFYKPLDGHYKIGFKKIGISLITTALVVALLLVLFIFIKNVIGFKTDHRHYIEEFISRNYFCALTVLGCIQIIRLIFQKQTIQIENEKLRSESLRSQFESLKNQLSPHFLFNSLAALKTLIEDSPKLANQYITHLSKVLRYTLQSNNKQIVTLSDELEFTNSYIFLLKMRFDTNLVIKTEIEEKYYNYHLPPLTIQTLVENGVKHNEISNEYPFQLIIRTTPNGHIQVLNKIQEKLTQEQGTGIGLSNLSKLFQLLGEVDIEITKKNGEFLVDAPLLKP